MSVMDKPVDAKSAIDELVGLIRTPDPFRNSPANLAELQLAALRERFAERRQQIKILDRRATDTGVKEIRSFDDVVPLLFSHTNYKSYPEAFVDKGQWRNMNLWLSTMSTRPVTTDVDDARDADEWIERLAADGHNVFATSGTSGKSSFLNRTAGDMENYFHAHMLGKNWGRASQPAQDRPVFSPTPAKGPHATADASNRYFAMVAAPGEHHRISDEPMRAMQSIRAGQIRRAIAAGTARPEDIADFERETAALAARMSEATERWMDKLFAYRDRPILIAGQWPILYRILQAGRARGVKDGDFHPDTLINNGGGTKGAVLPPDYREQIYAFFGLPKENYSHNYGMSEITAFCPYDLGSGGYLIPPWVVPLILDKSGEKLLKAEGEGVVEGRMALFDLTVEGRWGGIISGDKVKVEFGTAANGVKAPRVVDVARYAELEEGEDKLSCAGTIEAYVRGAIGT